MHTADVSVTSAMQIIAPPPRISRFKVLTAPGTLLSSHVYAGKGRRFGIKPQVDETVVSTDVLAPRGKHFPANPKPSDHLRLLHGGKSVHGRCAGLRLLGEVDKSELVLGKFRAISKPSVFKLLNCIDDLVGKEKVYLTQASYIWGDDKDKNRHRTTANYLQGINVVFVDLDVYGVPELSGLSPEDVTGKVLSRCRLVKVPLPLVISSGRGLYAYWVLDKRLEVSADKVENVRAWKTVQNRLMGVLRDFGVDPKVCDLTRVLRLVGTVNEKTGAVVRVIHDDGKRFSLTALLSAVEKLPAYKPASVLRPSSLPLDPSGVMYGAPMTVGVENLRRLLQADEQVADGMRPMRKRAWRTFRDIARVVIARGGIPRGQRDEFLFWMLATRFNAGLYEAGELPIMAEQFAACAEGGLNLWDDGSLSSLHRRMMRQTADVGAFRAHSARYVVIRRVGAFTAIRPVAFRPRGRNYQPLGYGAGFKLSHVYTPSVATLVSKLGITEEEQEGLDILIGPDEKRRRRRLKNVGPAKALRNTTICEQHAKGNSSIKRLAKRHGVSTSTAYRILSEERAPGRDATRSAVLALWQSRPDLSMRAIASQTGVSAASVSRWTRGHARSVVKEDGIASLPVRAPAPVAVPRGVSNSHFSFYLYRYGDKGGIGTTSIFEDNARAKLPFSQFPGLCLASSPVSPFLMCPPSTTASMVAHIRATPPGALDAMRVLKDSCGIPGAVLKAPGEGLFLCMVPMICTGNPHVVNYPPIALGAVDYCVSAKSYWPANILGKSFFGNTSRWEVDRYVPGSGGSGFAKSGDTELVRQTYRFGEVSQQVVVDDSNF